MCYLTYNRDCAISESGGVHLHKARKAWDWRGCPCRLFFTWKEVYIMHPTTRLLAFLARIAGESAPELEPQDQLEYWLVKIAERLEALENG